VHGRGTHKTCRVWPGSADCSFFSAFKKNRALAVQHLTEAKPVLSQFGQTPILARRDRARGTGNIAFALGQLIEQRLCLLQIARVKPFGEPAVDGCEQLPRLGLPPPFAPQPGEARCGAQLPRFRLLPPGGFERSAEAYFRSLLVRGIQAQPQLRITRLRNTRCRSARRGGAPPLSGAIPPQAGRYHDMGRQQRGILR